VKEQAWELQPTQDTGDSSLHSRTELDIGSAMSFIDHIFPMLYPFYQPRIIDGSRSWLLLLLVRSRSYLSTIISLVSYFFSVVPVGPEPGRMVCNEITWENLQMQMDDSMSALQGDLKRLSRFSSGESLLLSARVLANMLQLLKLEAIIGSSNNWKLHLDAAVELFKQMLEGHDGNQFVSPLLAIQEQMVDMPDASRPPPSMGPLSNAHQVSVRFSAAMLLYNDIVSSTVLGQSPRLRRYHSDLLGGGTASPLPGMLRLEEFIGCQNWALLQVGAVAALDAWKIEMLDKGHACELDLRERARTIDAALLSGLADLDSAERLICPSAPQTKVTGDNTINGTVFRRFHSSGPELEGSRILSTRIWAWSARAYLETVVSGWQPQHPEIQNVVAETIILFRQVDMVSHMATLIWPLCVIACLATAEEELVFRQFIGSLQGLQKLGIMRDVLNIVETVWKTRESRKGANMWSVRACLSCLGHRVLLA
jgi:hypothetical protein